MKARYAIAGLVGTVLVVWTVLGCTGYSKSRFAGPVSAEEPLPAALIADLERYVTRAMKRNKVPGVAMVLVHGDFQNLPS